MIALILALSLGAPTTSSTDTLFSSVVVRPRQSTSWLALRYLGAFDAKILDTMKMDNPSIHDLAKLEGGETIRLRRSMDRRKLTPERQIALASRHAVVTTLRGTGEIRHPDGRLDPLAVNTFLSTGDEIRTNAGASAEIVIDNQSVLRLRESSRLKLLGIQDSTLAQGKKAGTRVALDAGSLWVKVRTWAGPLVGFEVRLPSTIAGVHGTIFETSVTADSIQTVLVRDGVVSVRELGEGGKVYSLTKGQQISTRADRTLGAPSEPAPAPAVWPAEFQETDSAVEPVSGKASQEIVEQANLQSVLPPKRRPEGTH